MPLRRSPDQCAQGELVDGRHAGAVLLWDYADDLAGIMQAQPESQAPLVMAELLAVRGAQAARQPTEPAGEHPVMLARTAQRVAEAVPEPALARRVGTHDAN